MPAEIAEQLLDARILNALCKQPLGHRELMTKCAAHDRPLRRRLEWLIRRRYVSKANKDWKLGKRILHCITKRGRAYYEGIMDIAGIQEVTNKLTDLRIKINEEYAVELFVEMFAYLFRLTHKRFHEARDPKIYDAFVSRAEIEVQNYLNEKLATQDKGNMNGNLRSPYYEFYMATIGRPSEALREDGKLAYESGHGLTWCHVDLLCNQLKLYEKECLLLHNEQWLELKKGLDVGEELLREFNQRRMKLEQKYPGAYGKRFLFGLDNPGKRGLELALRGSVYA